MKPQPMSDAEIDSIIYASRQADEGPSALARRFAAARDAQWAAMIGEPVACSIRSRTYTPAIVSHDGRINYHEWGEWQPATLKHGLAVTDPARNTSPKVWEMLPLYAIKETP